MIPSRVIISGLIALTASVSVAQKPAFLTNESGYYMADEKVGHVHLPNLRFTVNFTEYPGGKIEYRTNNLGFRENADTRLIKKHGQRRILVVGDSHTDGVIENSLSFPNLLEAKLNAVDVINGGTGHFGFDHYHKFLTKHLGLTPDAFIVAVYTGNDFLDAAATLTEGKPLKRPSKYMERLKLAEKKNEPAILQALNQVYFFKTFPHMRRKAQRFAKARLTAIASLCKKNSIKCYTVIIPPRHAVSSLPREKNFAAAMSQLELSESDLKTDARMRTNLASWLTRKQFPHLDLTAAMLKGERKYFWDEDHHLNINGHRLASEALYGFLDLHENTKTE